jgi:hypothetical protein
MKQRAICERIEIMVINHGPIWYKVQRNVSSLWGMLQGPQHDRS